MQVFTLFPQKKISLNEFLRLELPQLLKTEISNSKIRRLIISGNIFVDSRQIRVPSFVLCTKSEVKVKIDEEKLFFEKEPDDISFELSENEILFEDENIILVDKPTHFPTEAGEVKSRDNLHAAIVRFLFNRQKIEHPNAKNPPYLGIMHRLDRDTSGVILFTKARVVNSACHEMFESHTAQKIYEAVVCVKSSEIKRFKIGQKFTVDFPMGRISPKGQRAKWGRVDEKKGGLSAITDFEILQEISSDKLKVLPTNCNFLLVKCAPRTGRTHQIRVHLSSLGLPILGDNLYGGENYERIMLQSQSLTFSHPISGEIMTVCARKKLI